MTSFSYPQQLTLAVTPKCTATLSILSNSFILYECWCDKYGKHKKKSNSIQRAVVGMTCIDTFASMGWWLSSWAVPKGTFALSAGNAGSCNFQGFLLQFAIGAPLYNCSLAMYYLLVIKYNWSNDMLYRIERWTHVAILTFSIGTSIAFLPLTLYNPIGNVCWVIGSPTDCGRSSNSGSDVPCERGDYAFAYGMALFYGPLWICVIACILSMIIIYTEVRSTHNRMDRYSVTPKGSSGRHHSLRRSAKDTSSVATQAILYSLSFFITWTPSTIWSIAHWFNVDSFGLNFASAFCEPLQGFWNCLVFLRKRPASREKIRVIFNTIFPCWFKEPEGGIKVNRNSGHANSTEGLNSSQASLYRSRSFSSRAGGGDRDDPSHNSHSHSHNSHNSKREPPTGEHLQYEYYYPSADFDLRYADEDGNNSAYLQEEPAVDKDDELSSSQRRHPQRLSRVRFAEEEAAAVVEIEAVEEQCPFDERESPVLVAVPAASSVSSPPSACAAWVAATTSSSMKSPIPDDDDNDQESPLGLTTVAEEVEMVAAVPLPPQATEDDDEEAAADDKAILDRYMDDLIGDDDDEDDDDDCENNNTAEKEEEEFVDLADAIRRRLAVPQHGILISDNNNSTSSSSPIGSPRIMPSAVNNDNHDHVHHHHHHHPHDLNCAGSSLDTTITNNSTASAFTEDDLSSTSQEEVAVNNNDDDDDDKPSSSSVFVKEDATAYSDHGECDQESSDADAASTYRPPRMCLFDLI